MLVIIFVHILSPFRTPRLEQLGANHKRLHFLQLGDSVIIELQVSLGGYS